MFDKKLLALLGDDKKYVVMMVVCNLLTTVSNILITFSICLIVDHLYKGEMEADILCLPFVLALAGVLLRFIFTLMHESRNE